MILIYVQTEGLVAGFSGFMNSADFLDSLAFLFLIAIIKSMSEQARFLLDDMLCKLAPDYGKTEITTFNK